MKDKIRTIFVGTPDFGIPALEALVRDSALDIVAVVTQPDRPVGRNRKLTPPPIKEFAQKLGLPVMQPEKIREIAPELKRLAPDVIVVIAYAQIIPEEILQIPKFGCVNLHGSLLPKYRGAAVIQSVILAGEKQTGVTVMKMDKRLDTGPIIFQKAVPIDREETAETLFRKLSELAGAVLPSALKQYVAGKLKPRPQDNKQANYVKALKKEDGRIDWNRPAVELERFVRAMNPWPGAFTKIREKGFTVKITKAASQVYEFDGQPVGKVFDYKNRLAVQCGKSLLILEKLQLEGRKEMTTEEFLRGHPDFLGSILT